MSDATKSYRTALRIAIKNEIREQNGIDKTELITNVDYPAEEAKNELDTLEKHGFVYIVDREVKLP